MNEDGRTDDKDGEGEQVSDIEAGQLSHCGNKDCDVSSANSRAWRAERLGSDQPQRKYCVPFIIYSRQNVARISLEAWRSARFVLSAMERASSFWLRFGVP